MSSTCTLHLAVPHSAGLLVNIIFDRNAVILDNLADIATLLTTLMMATTIVKEWGPPGVIQAEIVFSTYNFSKIRMAKIHQISPGIFLK
jgi:hypothetical protein